MPFKKLEINLDVKSTEQQQSESLSEMFQVAPTNYLKTHTQKSANKVYQIRDELITRYTRYAPRLELQLTYNKSRLVVSLNISICLPIFSLTIKHCNYTTELYCKLTVLLTN